MIQLNLVYFVRSQHWQSQKQFGALLVIRVLVVEQHLVVQIVVNRVAGDADHPIEATLWTLYTVS